MQFERLVQGVDARTLALETSAGRFVLTRHGNVVTCHCQLLADSHSGQQALSRRGALDGLFMISPKLSPKEFGTWLDRLLVDDLGGDPEGDVRAVRLDVATVPPALQAIN